MDRSIRFRAEGIVRDEDTGAPCGGLLVRAYDWDLTPRDLLGDAVTDATGIFRIDFALNEVACLVEKRPHLYVRVFDASGEELHSSRIRWRARTREEFELCVAAAGAAPEHAAAA